MKSGSRRKSSAYFRAAVFQHQILPQLLQRGGEWRLYALEKSKTGEQFDGRTPNQQSNQEGRAQDASPHGGR
jgi:hypothetical protein